MSKKAIDYKFNEDKLIAEFARYIDSTYNQHYAKEKFQATEFIIDGGHGTGFCIGNVGLLPFLLVVEHLDLE